MIKKIRNAKLKIGNLNTGMTILELVVVMAIFAMLSSVAVFNYGTFQSRIDITNLADDIALQVVQAQNAALSGLLPVQSYDSSWKPSYGVYFSSTVAPALDAWGANNENFIYFVNLNDPGSLLGENYIYSGLNSCNASLTYECINKYTIAQGDFISKINMVCVSGAPSCTSGTISNVSIIFDRPNSGSVIYANNVLKLSSQVSYVEITITNAKGNVTSTIDFYPSGRVQIN